MKILLARSPSPVQLLFESDPCITLVPNDVRWDDFGYNFHATISFYYHGKEPGYNHPVIDGYVIPQPAVDTGSPASRKARTPSATFEKWAKDRILDDSPTEIDALDAQHNPLFFTMLADPKVMQNYVLHSERSKRLSRPSWQSTML